MKTLLDNKKMLTLIAVGVLMTAGGVSAQVGQSRRADLSEEQKQALEQVRELREEGNFEEAKRIAEENDLPMRIKVGNKHRSENREAVEAALVASDYTAFVAATEDAPFADEIDEEFFAKMVQAYNLRQAGDMEGARAIMDELGIRPHNGEGLDRFKNLTDEQKAVLAEAKELHKSGDHESAKALIDSLGIEFVPHHN